MRRRSVLLVAAAVAAAALVAPSGALSTATLDRGVSVQVAADEDAVLGVEATDVVVSGDATDVDLLTLVNRHHADLTGVQVTVSEANASRAPSLSNVTGVDSLDVGESGTVRADVSCEGTTNGERVTLDVVAAGDGLEIRLTRHVEVACA